MAGAEARLDELGIRLPEVAPPVAAYVPAVVTGSHVYTSGQLPFVSGALPATGKVGDGHGLVPADDAKEYARACILNALAAVRPHGMPDFASLPQLGSTLCLPKIER